MTEQQRCSGYFRFKANKHKGKNFGQAFLKGLQGRGAAPLVAVRRQRNLLYPSKTEKRVRNATAFRGEATTNASPCNGTDLLYLPNVPVERLGQSSPLELLKRLSNLKIFPGKPYIFQNNPRKRLNFTKKVSVHKKFAFADYCTENVLLECTKAM